MVGMTAPNPPAPNTPAMTKGSNLPIATSSVLAALTWTAGPLRPSRLAPGVARSPVYQVPRGGGGIRRAAR